MKSALEEFEQHRPLMFSIAYRMLGTVSDAEDILQDTYLRWQHVKPDTVKSSKSYLSATVTRLCIDHLRSARVRREEYVGPWLPEPLMTGQDAQVASDDELADSLSMAFLMMLETLSPTERAVFLLHDIFSFEFGEVANLVGKTAANCRQIASRARRQLSGQPRFAPKPEKAEQLATDFLAACQSGEVDRLVAMLTDDATLYSDGGGKVHAARRPIYGPTKVARFLIGITQKAPADVAVTPVLVNGGPGLRCHRRALPSGCSPWRLTRLACERFVSSAIQTNLSTFRNVRTTVGCHDMDPSRRVLAASHTAEHDGCRQYQGISGSQTCEAHPFIPKSDGIAFF